MRCLWQLTVNLHFLRYDIVLYLRVNHDLPAAVFSARYQSWPQRIELDATGSCEEIWNLPPYDCQGGNRKQSKDGNGTGGAQSFGQSWGGFPVARARFCHERKFFTKKLDSYRLVVFIMHSARTWNIQAKWKPLDQTPTPHGVHILKRYGSTGVCSNGFFSSPHQAVLRTIASTCMGGAEGNTRISKTNWCVPD